MRSSRLRWHVGLAAKVTKRRMFLKSGCKQRMTTRFGNMHGKKTRSL